MKVLFLLAVVVLLGGCSRYQSPRFTLRSITESERSAEAVVLEFEIEAENRNRVELPLRQVRYSVDLEGTRVFRGSRSSQATIPSFGTQTVRLPAVVRADTFDLSLLDSASALRYAVTGELEYQTPGELAEVLFESGVRRPKAGLFLRGTIELQPSERADTPGE